MRAIEFKEQNSEVAKHQKEYLTLPAYREFESKEKMMITCQGLSFRERLKVLFTGKIWMSESTFGKLITPRRFSVDKWDVLDKDYFNLLELQKKRLSHNWP